MKHIYCFIMILLFNLSIFAGDVKFPGKFGFALTLFPSVVDSSNTTYSESENLFFIDKIKFTTEIQGTLLFTFADFYTLYPWISDQFIIESGPWFGNSLTIAMDNKFSILKEPPLSMDIGINLQYKINYWNKLDNIDNEFYPLFFYQGELDTAGLLWRISCAGRFDFNPEKIIFNNPAETNEVFFDTGTVECFGALAFNFFNFFAPSNVKCYLYTENTFKAELPYFYTEEKQKTFSNDLRAGILFDIAGFQPFCYYWLRTYNYYNTSAPLDGSNGSDIQWLDSDEWSAGAPVHSNDSRRMGFRTGFQYAKDWFVINFEYAGDIETVPLLYKSGGEYSSWVSTIEMWVQIKVGGKPTNVLYRWDY